MFGKEVVKSGYLTKSPPDNKSAFHGWKRRYFVLIDSMLTYPFSPRNIRIEYYSTFEERKSGNPLGMIDLNSCSGVLKREQMKSHRNVLDIVTPTRVFHLSADSVEERDQWVHVLNLNIFPGNQRNILRFDPNRRSSDFTPDSDMASALLTSMCRDENITRARGGNRAQSLRSTKSVSIEPVSSMPDMFVPNYPPLAAAVNLPSNLRLISTREEGTASALNDSVCDNEIFSEKGFTSVPLNSQDMHMSLPINNESPYINVTYPILKSVSVSPTHPMMPSPYKKIPQSVSVIDFAQQQLFSEATPACVDSPRKVPVLEEYAKVHRNK